jgi:hypothetical protein
MTPTPLQQVIEHRKTQLERIKPLISLKTYDALQKKLADEARGASRAHDTAVHVAKYRDREQALPKTLFTQKQLPRKAIRID